MTRNLTSVGVVWALSSVVCALLCSTSFSLPYWMEGITLNTTVYLGVFRRCNFLVKAEDGSTHVERACGRYTAFNDIPSTAWRACTVLIGIACGLLLLVCLTATWSCCIKDIISSSSAKVAGMIQFFAALLLTISVAAYPSGWGSVEVQQVCGPLADSYRLGHCTFGWAFYMVILGTVMAFVCAGLSVKASKARSYTQTDHINNYLV